MTELVHLRHRNAEHMHIGQTLMLDFDMTRAHMFAHELPKPESVKAKA